MDWECKLGPFIVARFCHVPSSKYHNMLSACFDGGARYLRPDGTVQNSTGASSGVNVGFFANVKDVKEAYAKWQKSTEAADPKASDPGRGES